MPFSSGASALRSLPSVASKSGNYTLLYTDGYILANAAGGAFTLTLPTAAGHPGQVFEIKKVDATANVVHITTTSAQTIDGSAPPYDLTSPMAAVTLLSDGSVWWAV